MTNLINSEKVIGNALIEINESIFDVEQIFDIEQKLYQNTIDTKYYIMGLSMQAIREFCSVYSFFASYNENSREIYLNNSKTNMERMKKYFRSDFDQELTEIFKKSATKNVKRKIFE